MPTFMLQDRNAPIDRSSAEPSRLDMDVEEPPPQVMPSRDFSSPGVNMSVGATSSSSQTTSLLVSAAELPTFTVVTPGSREFTKLLTYARMCENQGQDLRIDKWPRLLRSNMNTQYRFNFCMAEGSSRRQDEWQSFSASQLRECSRAFGKNAKRSREAEPTQSVDQNRSSSDSAKRPKPVKNNSSSTQPSVKKRCRGCGWNLKKSEQGKYRCPRNGNEGCGKDSRRNNSGAPWDQSEVGKKWTSMGYPGGLPKVETITLQNAEERKKSFTGGESVCYAQHSDELLISRELINFSLYDDVQAGNRRK